MAKSSTVEINNQVNISNSNESSQTDIKVETNGEVIEYHSDEPNQKIEVKASNNDSSIIIDGELITETKSNEEITNSPTPLKFEDKNTEEDQENVFNFLNDKLNMIKNFFFFLDLF